MDFVCDFSYIMYFCWRTYGCLVGRTFRYYSIITQLAGSCNLTRSFFLLATRRILLYAKCYKAVLDVCWSLLWPLLRVYTVWPLLDLWPSKKSIICSNIVQTTSCLYSNWSLWNKESIAGSHFLTGPFGKELEVKRSNFSNIVQTMSCLYSNWRWNKESIAVTQFLLNLSLRS